MTNNCRERFDPCCDVEEAAPLESGSRLRWWERGASLAAFLFLLTGLTLSVLFACGQVNWIGLAFSVLDIAVAAFCVVLDRALMQFQEHEKKRPGQRIKHPDSSIRGVWNEEDLPEI